MKVNDEDLKTLYQERTARSARQRLECPSPELLHQAATGTLGGRERERVTDHVVVCADCAREYQLVHRVEVWANQVAGTSGEAAPEGRLARAPWWSGAAVGGLFQRLLSWQDWRAVAVAAMIVLAVGTGVTVWRITRPQPLAEGERAGTAVAVTVEPADKALLQQAPQRLAWSTAEPADRYQVVVYDFESTTIWESPWVTVPSVTLPDAVRERLPRGRLVYWRVVAQAGIERRQSSVFQFVISP